MPAPKMAPILFVIGGLMLPASAGAASTSKSAGQIAPPPQERGEICVYDLMAKTNRRCLTPDWDEIHKHPLGTAENPVRVYMPGGEKDYLSRLECAGGGSPAFDRVGSKGTGPYGTVLDLFKVRCPGGETRQVYMDMYHPKHRETRSLPGFEMSSE